MSGGVGHRSGEDERTLAGDYGVEREGATDVVDRVDVLVDDLRDRLFGGIEPCHRLVVVTPLALDLVGLLDEPEPRVYFMGFGESSLNFNLYVHSRELSDRLPLMHAVHEEILGALRKNGIEIPFPQRDLHLRSVDDKLTAFRRDDDGKDDATE